jgi:hypothetical protein
VTVERAGTGAVASAVLGMRLEGGDVVTVAESATASVYLAGGRGIRRLAAGERLAISAGSKPQSEEARALSGSALRVSEAGLWVLNDPDGRILVAAMRGGGHEESAPVSGAAEPLSPRYETVVADRPTFRAVLGPRPAAIAVAAGQEIVGRTGPLDGDGPWSVDGVVELRPGGLYSWRVESAADRAPLSSWIPFRIASSEDVELARRFESEVAALDAATGGASAADLLRCGHYLTTQSWTPLLAAAERLLKVAPDSEVARRARDRAIRGLRLDVDQVGLLLKELGS